MKKDNIRIQELAGIEIDEDAYASEKAKGLFVQATVHLRQLDKLFSEGSFLYQHTKRAGGDTKEFELCKKSIEHLKSTIDHAEESAKIPNQNNRRDNSSW